MNRTIAILPLLALFWHDFASLPPARAEAVAAEATVFGEDLGEELLKPRSGKSALPRQQQLLEPLDVAANEARVGDEESWSLVVRQMQTAQARLDRSDASGSASAAQSAALLGIDAIAAELTKRQSRCRGGQPNGGAADQRSPTQSSTKPGAKKPGSSGQVGTTPAQSAPATTGRDADLPSERVAAGSLAKDLWGQLPLRQREQILQPQRDAFLPKYATEIEAYFRALADPHRATGEPQ